MRRRPGLVPQRVPLLDADLCATYAGRPFLCRAYGLPTDAYAVQGEGALAFLSLCRLYDGAELRDYVRAIDLKQRLAALSLELVGRDVGRFTSLEAITAALR